MKKIILAAFAFGVFISTDVFAGCPTGGPNGHTAGTDCQASGHTGHWHCKSTGWVCE